MSPTRDEPPSTDRKPTRRGFFGWAAMGLGLFASAAVGLTVVGRFLLPRSRGERTRRLYVGQLSELPLGESQPFRAPSGETFLLTNTVDGVVAFNATCPHLGCKVHWEAQHDRFFCPCHGGAFAPDGTPTEGPPKDENTPLKPLALTVDGGAIYAMVPVA